MRLYAVSEAAAKALAAKAHAHRMATCPEYSDSVAKGLTKRWAIPTRDVDEKGNPIGEWYIPVEDIVIDSFTAKECEKLDRAGKDYLAEK